LIAGYMIGYGIGRLWVELLRIDEANTIFGLRVNVWMSFVLIGGGLAIMLWPGGAKEDLDEPLEDDADVDLDLAGDDDDVDDIGPDDESDVDLEDLEDLEDEDIVRS